MPVNSKQAIWRQAELQFQLFVLAMVGPVIAFAAWNRGVPAVFFQPQLYVVMLAGLVAGIDAASLARHGRIATPRLLMPALMCVAAVSSVWHTGITALPWMIGGIIAGYMRLPPWQALAAGLVTAGSGIGILAWHGDTEQVLIVRAINWSLLALGLLTIVFQANRRAMEALGRTSDLLQGSINAMSQGLSVVGPDSRVLLYNQRVCEMLDLPDALMATHPTFAEVVRHQHAHGHFGQDMSLVDDDGRNYVAALGADPQAAPPRYLRRTHTGRTLEVQTHVLADGSLVRTFSDVTEYAQARRAAEAAAEAKAQFLANMSHELRTPISSLLGLLRLLEFTPLDATQKDYLRKMDRAGRSLLDLVNDILDLSKIEAGKMTLSAERLVLGEFLRDLQVVGETLRADRALDLRFDIAPGVPSAVLADSLRLRQVMVNLVGNAIKFTREGSVTVRVESLGAAEGGATLRWTVRDTGIGIAPEHRQRVFDSFTQADASISRSHGGTGLGLAITQRLLDLMGARLELESEPGVGSSFWFDITAPVQDSAPSAWPTEPPEATAAPQGQGQRLQGLRVLVADDEPINRMVAQRLLEREGCVVRTATNGQEALEVIADDPAALDCVLMDMQMPRLDGLEATRRLRQALRVEHLPVYAVTANVLSAERQACLDAGMTGHMGKPVDLELMVALLRQHLPPAA